MRASRWLRRVEISLWIVGISLLAVALEATVDRWQYQAQQEQALFSPAEPSMRTAAMATPSSNWPEGIAGPSFSEGSVHYAVPAGPEQPAAEQVSIADRDKGPLAERAKAEPQRPDTHRNRIVADPSALGRIEIPRLGLTAIVRDGADEETLARAVGLVPGTAKPGDVGNVVLAGHRDTFFRSLRKIEVDDRIRLVVPPHTYEYRVSALRVVAPDETSVMDSNGIEELTLVTCYPFRFLGPAPDRYIVSATRVN